MFLCVVKSPSHTHKDPLGQSWSLLHKAPPVSKVLPSRPFPNQKLKTYTARVIGLSPCEQKQMDSMEASNCSRTLVPRGTTNGGPSHEKVFCNINSYAYESLFTFRSSNDMHLLSVGWVSQLECVEDDIPKVSWYSSEWHRGGVRLVCVLSRRVQSGYGRECKTGRRTSSSGVWLWQCFIGHSKITMIFWYLFNIKKNLNNTSVVKRILICQSIETSLDTC